MSKKEASLTLVDAVPLERTKLAKFQKQTIAAIRFVEGEDVLNTRRRVVIGFALHAIKANLERGAWLPWIKANLKGRGYAQLNFYMRAAEACARTMQLTAPDLLALPATKITALKLQVKAGDGFHAKLAEFCGELSFNELLDAHGIKENKKIGGARHVGDGKPVAETDAETLYLQARDEISSVIERAETLFLKENRLQFLAGNPDEVRGAVNALRELANKVEAAAKPMLKPTKG